MRNDCTLLRASAAVPISFAASAALTGVTLSLPGTVAVGPTVAFPGTNEPLTTVAAGVSFPPGALLVNAYSISPPTMTTHAASRAPFHDLREVKNRVIMPPAGVDDVWYD